MLQYLLLFIHLVICVALVGVVLMQSGKGGGLAGGAFGGSAQTVFGGRGATDFLTRATMVLGGLFFTTALVLALISSNLTSGHRSLINQEARRSATSAGQQQQPGAPGGTPRTAAPAAPATPAPAAPAQPAPAGAGR